MFTIMTGTVAIRNMITPIITITRAIIMRMKCLSAGGGRRSTNIQKNR